jgi:membrane-bound ClpP family serine protease
MAKKGETSALKAWLIVLASLIDDAAVLALVFLGLWFFHVKITWTIIVIVVVVMIAFVFIMHRALVPSLRRRKVTGAEGMLGMVGRVTEPLKPKGVVKVKDEYWKARSLDGDIGMGEEVEVVGIAGLNLEVKRKAP